MDKIIPVYIALFYTFYVATLGFFDLGGTLTHFPAPKTLVIFDAVFPFTPKIGNLCIHHYFKDKHFLNIEKVNAFLKIKSDKISHKAPKMQKFNLNSGSALILAISIPSNINSR